MLVQKSKFTGFAELRNPNDLLDKLKHDFYRMMENEQDAYAAFDFFITAEHMLDWLHPDRSEKKKRQEIRESNIWLKITSHIANGAKHFVASAKHHTSVCAIDAPRYIEDSRHDSGCVETPIVIKLSPDEAVCVGASEIDVGALAYQVLEYWRKNLTSNA